MSAVLYYILGFLSASAIYAIISMLKQPKKNTPQDVDYRDFLNY